MTSHQVIEHKRVIFTGWRGSKKKGETNFEVSLQMLLKTHVEKMSTLGAEQMLMKTNELKISSEYVDEKTR